MIVAMVFPVGATPRSDILARRNLLPNMWGVGARRTMAVSSRRRHAPLALPRSRWRTRARLRRRGSAPGALRSRRCLDTPQRAGPTLLQRRTLVPPSPPGAETRAVVQHRGRGGAIRRAIGDLGQAVVRADDAVSGVRSWRGQARSKARTSRGHPPPRGPYGRTGRLVLTTTRVVPRRATNLAHERPC